MRQRIGRSSPFPSHEVDPYRGMTPHIGVTSERARALHALAGGSARIVVASAAAVLPRVSAPARLLGASVDLRPNQDIAPTDLGELLVEAGFSREDPADEHGEFAIRGGILDIYPAGDAQPVRLEFIGDTIESLRTYDPSTQRSVQPIDQLTVVPLRDVLGDDRSATIFDFLAQVKESQDHRRGTRRSRRARHEAPRDRAPKLRGCGRRRRRCARAGPTRRAVRHVA